MEELATVGARTEPLPRLERARDIPPRRTWLSLARRAIEQISAGELRKVVLSRSISLAFRDRIPASTVLRRLMKMNPQSTAFAVKRRSSIFLGATPEMLTSVNRGEVEVDCLAASSPRSKDGATDERLGARLLADLKSRREHQLVVQAAVSALSPMSSSIEVPDGPVLKRLAAIQHLYTPVRARLRDADQVWAAAMALWPNPAIAGAPKRKAVDCIHGLEGIDRGWYSGIVGMANSRLDQADFAVSIRSGVVKGRRALIYAGAGLVAGSEPKAEFEETGWKLRTMQSALGVDGPNGG
jgi:menaquinone-specific isochorismate synthase